MLIWIAIGAAAVGLLVGLWLRAILIAMEQYFVKRKEGGEFRKQTDLLKKELSSQALRILNDPTISKEEREKILRVMKEFGLGYNS